MSRDSVFLRDRIVTKKYNLTTLRGLIMQPYGEVFFIIFLSHLLLASDPCVSTIKCYFGDLSQAKTKVTCLLPLVLSGEKLKKPPIYLFAYLDLSL